MSQTEESKDNKKKTKIPQSVIDHYSKYRNKSVNIKSFLVMGTKFDIEDKYEIIDSGKVTF
jgi:mitogen-activated protein kinase 1/3/mitogen-activated protein kinase 6